MLLPIFMDEGANDSKVTPSLEQPFLYKFLSFIQEEFVWKLSKVYTLFSSQFGFLPLKFVHYPCMKFVHLGYLLPAVHSRTLDPFCKWTVGRAVFVYLFVVFVSVLLQCLRSGWNNA